MMQLDMAGIAVSVGSACESGSLEPSHVLCALGMTTEEALEGLRFSFSRYNSEDEVVSAVETLKNIIHA